MNKSQAGESASDSTPPPHALPAEAVARWLEADSAVGLSGAGIAARRSRYGPNELAEARPPSRWIKFFRQFNEVVIWVLAAAAVVSGFLGEWADAIAIIAIVLLNGLLGFIQEERAGEALAALKKLSAPQTRVWRDGKIVTLPARELVPGDRVELEAGDLVPADLRLISSVALRVDESSITGESTPVEKEAGVSLDARTALADRRNMAHFGTLASAGKASALVVATGMRTELGRIAGLLQHHEPEPTPLQRRLADLGRLLVYICLGIVGVIFVLQVMRGARLHEAFLLAVSLAVAAVPEGLPAVVTIALALGLQRMVRRHALIRRLPSVETLGSVTVICSDKTGTLTRNEMTVRQAYAGGRWFAASGSGYAPVGEWTEAGTAPPGNAGAQLTTHAEDQAATAANSAPAASEGSDSVIRAVGLMSPLREALTIGVWCNAAEISPAEDGAGWSLRGDPTEGALIVAGLKAGISRASAPRQTLLEIPFDSDRKLMTMLVQAPDGRKIYYTKGAPEVLLARCSGEWLDGQAVSLSEGRRREILAAGAAMAAGALRVLAMGYRDAGEAESAPFDEREMVFAGLVGMFDPPRDEARGAVARCVEAGVRPVMITGDHPDTALAIAREVGIARGETTALSGAKIDEMDDAALGVGVEKAGVFARVTAEHKLRVVRAFQARGEVVAMTGDGVNDAPAVEAADIGIAMGRGGTDVTRKAADMVLTDDNFASIVSAIEEGRGVFDNIRKFVHYLLACNTGEVVFMFVGAIVGWKSPLIPIQILWINLVTDALPALALGIEPPEPGVMRRPPRPAKEGVITWPRARRIIFHGSLIAGATLAAFALMLRWHPRDADHTIARTVAFCVLAYSQLFYSFSCRSERYTLPQLGLFSNWFLIGAILVSGTIQTAVFLPHARNLFHVEAGLTWEWPVLLALSLLPVTLIETLKLLTSRRRSP